MGPSLLIFLNSTVPEADRRTKRSFHSGNRPDVLNVLFQYRIPDDYDADVFPDAVVDVEVGLFYKTLIYLHSKTSSFGMKHYLHLRWKGLGE